MLNICYMTIILSYYFLCVVHMMQSFVYEKRLWGNYNYSPDESFLTGNVEILALVLSNVYKITSAPDCPSFGSIWLSTVYHLLRYSTLSLVLLYPYMYSVDAAVKGGGWVEEIKKFLNMKIKKFSRNSGEICRISWSWIPRKFAEFWPIPHSKRTVCMKIKKFLNEIPCWRNSVSIVYLKSTLR